MMSSKRHDTSKTSTGLFAFLGILLSFFLIEGSADAEEETPTIEHPEHLEHFFGQLAAAEKGQAGAMARMAVFSDSINGWDGVTSHLRHVLQKRFGDGGRGFVQIAKGWNYQHQRDVRWEHSETWRTHVLNRGHGPGDRYGWGGVMAADGSRRSQATFETTENHPSGGSVSRFRLFYQAFPGAGSAKISVDDEEPVEVPMNAAKMEDRVHDLRVPDGPHRFQVSVGERNIRLYGVVMERDGPGVVVDAIALIGARAARLLKFAPAHLQRQVQLREPDLMVFWLGANNATANRFGRSAFVRDYGKAISIAKRGRPEASCLVVSVTDIGERGTGESLERIPQVIEAQREVAQAQRCGFFDLHAAMGGPGTMKRWYRSSPRLATPDFRHLTPAGAEKMGRYFEKALISAYEARR